MLGAIGDAPGGGRLSKGAETWADEIGGGGHAEQHCRDDVEWSGEDDREVSLAAMLAHLMTVEVDN